MDANQALADAIARDKLRQQDAQIAIAGREAAARGEGEAYWGNNKLSRMYNALPPETKVRNTSRKGIVSDPMDLAMKSRIAAAVALTQANSPLDPNNKEHIPELGRQYNKIRKNLKNPVSLRPIKKLTKTKEKGGFIFTKLQNKMVYPQSDRSGL